MQYEQMATTLDAAFHGYRDLGQWAAAAQTRMQAATLAARHGHVELFRRHSAEAIQLAEIHDLRGVEISFRVQRYGALLRVDGSGRALDELKQELDFALGLSGKLAERLEEFRREADAACAGLRRELGARPEAFVGEVRQQALAFSLTYLAGKLDDCVVGLAVQTDRAAVCARLGSILDEVQHGLRESLQFSQCQLLELAADLKERLGDPDTAEDARALAKALCTQGPGVRLEPRGRTEDAAALLNEAHDKVLKGEFRAALALLTEALRLAPTPALRRTVLLARIIVLYELGSVREAEADVSAALSLVSEEVAREAGAATGEAGQLLGQEENLFLMKAYLAAKSGRPADAWEAAEQGRAQDFKRAAARSAGTQPAMVPFEQVRAWAAAERIAFLWFGATRWGTLALLVGPDDAQPQAEFLRFRHADLTALLAPSRLESEASEGWTQIIFGAVEELSAGLLRPLEGRLRALTENVQVLYVLPDSLLFRAPFAALTFADGTTLMERCPVALAPSAAVVAWCQSRRRGDRGRSCLAAAVDKGEGFALTHLTQLQSLPWPNGLDILAGGEATADRVAAEAPCHAVIHLSCHGGVSPDVKDTLAASQLRLAGDSPLTARNVLDWRLDADLVFLNACQSGRFRLQGRTQVSGFWRAFLLAGARSVIGTLTHVDPAAAGDLAEAFYRSWLQGATKAQALNAAQRQLKAAGLEANAWASHSLIGDYH